MGEAKLKVVAGPSKVAGGVSRLVKLPDGSGRIETWVKGLGWTEGGARVDELMPGACTPVTPELAERLGIPPEELA